MRLRDLDYVFAGDNGLLKIVSEAYRDILIGSKISEQDSLAQFVNSHIVFINEGRLTVFLLQDSKVDQGGNRTIAPSPAYFQIELPNDVLNTLIKEIQKTPDLLELIYQNTFPQLDSTDKEPGARRIKANRFYLFDYKEALNLKNLLNKIKTDTSAFINKNRLIKEFLESVPRFQYKCGPYGTGDLINK